MRRFAEDRALMRSRVKFARRYFALSDPPLYPVSENYGHWRDQMLCVGRWRKRKPGDCGHARCGICHSHKWLPKARANDKRAAIEFELRAG